MKKKETIASSSTNRSIDSIHKSDSSENLHQFDLHGCFVFDRFCPISCPPRRGIVAKLVVLPSREHIAHAIHTDIPDTATLPSFPETLEWTSSYSVLDHVSKESSIFVIPIVVPPQVLEEASIGQPPLDNSLGQQLRSLAQSSMLPSELQRVALDLIQSRSAWIKKASSKMRDGWAQLQERQQQERQQQERQNHHSLKRDKRDDDSSGAATDSLLTLVNQPGVKDDSVNGDNCQEELQLEIDHYKDFLESVPERTESLEQFKTTQRWLEDIVALLRLMEAAGCLAVVLVGLVPNGVMDEQTPSCLQLASLLSLSVRTQLRMPAILTQQQYREYKELMSLYQTAAVERAVVSPIPLKAGDHVYREIREKGALRLIKHHGIYTGNGRVIHFSGNEMSLQGLLLSKQKAKVKSASIIQFMKQGRRMKIRHYDRCDPATVVIQRAEDALSEQGFEEYNIFKNNCEHFCSYCKTGKGKSKQVEVTKGITYAVAGLTAAAVVVALALQKK